MLAREAEPPSPPRPRRTPARAARAIILQLAVCLGAGGCVSSHPPADLFGVRLGMTREAVDGALGRRHDLTFDEAGAGGAKQVWRLEDATFRSLAVTYHPDHTVKYVTAHGRADGRPLRYRDLGDLGRATLKGRYFYIWNVAADGAAPYAVVARGTDPQYLTSVSLYRP